MFHAISYSCKCKIYNTALRNHFIKLLQFARSLTSVDHSGHISVLDHNGVNSYLKHMPSVKIVSDLQDQKWSFSTSLHVKIQIKVKISLTLLENLIPESRGNIF